MTTITVRDLKTLIGNINLIDIRNGVNYNNNHIFGAKNMDYTNLVNAPDKYLNKGEKYYFYCQKGMRSHKLCSYLDRLGYNVVNVAGGYEAWILEL